MLRLRSWMFVPGHSEKMVSKSLGLDIGVAMLDLEDGVAPGLKAAARLIVAQTLQTPKHGGPLRYVRVNSCDSGELDLDLEAVLVPGIEGIVLPKVETVEQVREVEDSLARLEAARCLPAGGVRMTLAIETARAVIATPALATASTRVSALIFGAEDFSRDIDLPTRRTGQARDFFYVRSAIVVAAAAARVHSVDAVWPDMKDAEGLLRDAVLGRDLGFTGKSLIHPGQVKTINSVFSPTEKDIAFAEELVLHFESALAAGHGSISFQGTLVDRPIYERARATLRAGERASVKPAASIYEGPDV